MQPNTNSDSPEQDLRYHTYLSHVIPWYVRMMWVVFWIFAIAYAISYFIPAFQTEIISPP